MSEFHVVSGLMAKHSELAGLIQFHQTEIERISSSLKHLDATIKLFSPDINLRTLGAKRVYNDTSKWRHYGENQWRLNAEK